MGQRVGDEVTPEQWAPIAGHDGYEVNLEWVTRSQNNKHATHVLGHRAGQFGPGRQRVCA